MTVELENRKVDDYGNVYFQVKDLYGLILKGFKVNEFLIEDGPELKQFVQTCRALDNDELMPNTYAVPEEPLDVSMSVYRNKWLIPARYASLDLRVWLNEKCTSEVQRARVASEMDVFEKYELQDMLRSLVYLVDIFRKNKTVWGVGRGSSVSSYVLYLIGIHRVDSIAYELDFNEFLD